MRRFEFSKNNKKQNTGKPHFKGGNQLLVNGGGQERKEKEIEKWSVEERGKGGQENIWRDHIYSEGTYTYIYMVYEIIYIVVVIRKERIPMIIFSFLMYIFITLHRNLSLSFYDDITHAYIHTTFSLPPFYIQMPPLLI